MSENDFKDDFFGGNPEDKKVDKLGLFDGYNRHRFFPHVRIPAEYVVILAISVLVLVVVSFAAGVERGKRIATAKYMGVLSNDENVSTMSDSYEWPENQQVSVIVQEDAAEPVVSETAPVKSSKSKVTTSPSAPATVVKGKVTTPPAAQAAESAKPKAAASRYVVQLASFKGESEARREAEKVKKKGFEGHWIKKGNWYQVYVSGYQSNDQAKTAMKALSREYKDCFVKKAD